MNATPPSRTATIVAVAAVVLWAAFTIWLAIGIHSDQIEWARMAWLFGSVQALAFAGAGALFGTAVQRERVNKAEQRADSAQADADAQRDVASKGRALAALLQSEDVPADGGGDSGISAMGPADDNDSEVRRAHARMSRALFGPLVE